MASKEAIILGARVELTTTFDEPVQGIIFAYDKASSCVVLQTPAENGRSQQLRVLKTNFIKELRTLAAPPEQYGAAPLPQVDLEKCKAREDDALKEAEVKAQAVGVGVTQEAQNIYDALAKTLPCRWAGTDIIVLDEVRVASPYTPESCSGQEQRLLDQVVKVLVNERARLGLA
mmetsp:Transcript_13965/g.50829  ORF Transcript_13965/g.50829 Transcript_13965/m.50829 type:complete len:174 (+) Transcript_13965:276-797(+)